MENTHKFNEMFINYYDMIMYINSIKIQIKFNEE